MFILKIYFKNWVIYSYIFTYIFMCTDISILRCVTLCRKEKKNEVLPITPPCYVIPTVTSGYAE